MSKLLLLTVFFCVVLSFTTASAQNLCPAGISSDKLICLIPQVYGKDGLVLGGSAGNFNNSFLTSNLRPLNSAVARQSVLLPLVSPSSGITSSWDSAAKVWIPSTDSFGPILGERAETIGKNRLFLAFGYQYVKYDRLDGSDLKDLPEVFTQPDFTLDTGEKCSLNVDDTRECGFIRDVIKTENRVDLKVHQFTTFVTYGLTNRIDVSIVIPIETVRMGISSNATIVDNSNSKNHSFTIQDRICGTTSPFKPCRNQVFSRFGTASGIGDMTLRVIGTAWKAKGERAAVALGVDVRLPTGDALNFLGAGAAGVKPFVVWSFRSRISPHVLVGYETNGSSVLAGDTSTGQKERLPGQLTYSGGADVWLTKRFTVAFDLVGQQVFQGKRSSVTQVPEPAACLDPSGACDPHFDNDNAFADPKIDSNLSQSTGSFNLTNASLGAKVRPFSNLLITGNVLIKLNDGGLRAKIVPLVGVSFTF